MKVEFYCDSGANIHSCRKEVIDLDADYEISDEEWREMSDDAKYDIVREWAEDYLEIGFSDVDTAD